MLGRSGRTRALTLVIGLVAAATVTGVAGVASGTVAADGPNVGTPWIVTVGDSAISGEAGRWAGNTNQSSSKVDAGGADAYFDNASRTAEQIPGCHRSEAAEAHIFGGANSLNLACSGARTYTQAGSPFKPGLDFYNGAGGKGQALMLQEFAATHNVKAVTVLIGANNFGFADIVQQCVTNWLTSPSWWKNYCYDDSSISSRFTASAVAARTNEVAGRDPQRGGGDDGRRLHDATTTRSSSRRTRRRSRAAARSATPRAAGHVSRSVVVASGTVMPIGPTTPRS